MIQTGLVSVTFRKLAPQEIIRLVRQANLQAIEWGGDVHVPHGDLERARQVFEMTTEAGITVASYGSYYRAGCGLDNPPFESVLATALALHAPTLRVWAGDRGSKQADRAWRRQVQEDTRRIAALAGPEGITVAFEYHPDTLTDTAASARELLKAIDRENVRSYWQPPVNLKPLARSLSLQEILPWLSNLHVYHQRGPEPDPLEEGMREWSNYMQTVQELPGDRYALIEFVRGESPAQFLQDAEALKKICRSTKGEPA